MRWPGGLSATRRRLGGETELARQGEDAFAIDMRLDKVRHRLEARIERLRLARLHKAEMALRQRDLVVARQRADDRDAERLDRLGDEAPMPFAADAVDDDPGDPSPHRRSRSP